MMKTILLLSVIITILFISIVMYFGNTTSTYANKKWEVSDTFGTPLNRDIDGDGDKDAAVILHNIAGGNSYDLGYSIYVDNKGKVYVTGYSEGKETGTDLIVIRLNSNGSLDKKFGSQGKVVLHNIAGGNKDDFGHSIHVDKTGKFYVTGWSWNGSNDDLIITKLNSDGSLDKSFGSDGKVVIHNIAGGKSSDLGYSVYVDTNDKVYITGWSWNRFHTDPIVIRLNNDGSLDKSFGSNGKVILNNIAGGSKDDRGHSIHVDKTGKIYVTGWSWNDSNGDLVVIKLDSNGSLDTTFGSQGKIVLDNIAGEESVDFGYSICTDKNGKVYVTGCSSNGSDYDLVVIRLNDDGSLDKTFDNDGYIVLDNIAGGDSSDMGYSIYVDKNDKVYVTGCSSNGSDDDLIVVKIE